MAKSYKLSVLSGVNKVPSKAWDKLAGQENPFVSHAFLDALEQSGSASPESGWQALHLWLESENGEPLGALPLYLKSHSYGEFVFDWAFAEAFERAGGNYYPKLLCAVPFTPVSSPRLLLGEAEAAARQKTGKVLVGELKRLGASLGISSLHINFLLPDECRIFEEQGFLMRLGQQYHWPNRNYADFDEFLAALSSRKRKTIARERQAVAETGIKLERLSGEDISETHWRNFFEFYQKNAEGKWGWPYLTWEFFEHIHATMQERCLLVWGHKNDRPLCGALNFLGKNRIFGRNWGSNEFYKHLHFEACYYQAIEEAIARRLEWVEAGAQGPHKIARGYLPQSCYSCHFFYNEGLQQAVARFIEEEAYEVEASREAALARSPYRSGMNVGNLVCTR